MKSKGAMPMEIVMAVVLVMVAVAVAFSYWLQTDSRVSGSVPRAIECIFGVLCVNAFAPRKKGIVLTTTMLATVVFLVVVSIVIFLIFAGLQAEAGSTSSSFAFGAFDALMRLLGGG